MSMISQHSYFYQADATADITDSAIDQVSLEEIDLSAKVIGAKIIKRKLGPIDPQNSALTAS